MDISWVLVLEILYAIVIIAILLRIIYDTQNVIKTLAYLLLVIFLPLVGIIIYFSFGINYRKNKIYSKKIIYDEVQQRKVLEKLDLINTENLQTAAEYAQFAGLMRMIYKTDRSPSMINNSAKLLINGEENSRKFWQNCAKQNTTSTSNIIFTKRAKQATRSPKYWRKKQRKA